MIRFVDGQWNITECMVLRQTLHPDVASLIADIYVILDAETCGPDAQTLDRTNLTFLIKQAEKVIFFTREQRILYYSYFYSRNNRTLVVSFCQIVC